MDNGDELIGTSPQRRRGRPRKPPRPCEFFGCNRQGTRYVSINDTKVFVCETHRKQHDRLTPGRCSVRGCDGLVILGKNRRIGYCRSHEDHYLSDAPQRRDGALHQLGQRITFDNVGPAHCWQVEGETGRPDIEVDGLRWKSIRFLWVRFYGPHRGGLQLHHVCGNALCVNPSHCWPVTAKANLAIEANLGEYSGTEWLTRFAPITEEFDKWCRHEGLDHGHLDSINNGSRRYVEPGFWR